MKGLQRPIRRLTAAMFLLMSVATGAETKPVYYIYLRDRRSSCPNR